MGNHEVKDITDKVHLFLAFKRTKDKENGSTKTLREVIKDPSKEQETLEMLKSKCKILGGTWRIHKTVSMRDCQKAMKLLQHMLIDHPEKASYIDSAWRTCLLQRECIVREQERWMFDIDSNDKDFQEVITSQIDAYAPFHQMAQARILKKVITPSGGLHIITLPFDTRKVLQDKKVTLLRDGYIYVDKVE